MASAIVAVFMTRVKLKFKRDSIEMESGFAFLFLGPLLLCVRRSPSNLDTDPVHLSIVHKKKQLKKLIDALIMLNKLCKDYEGRFKKKIIFSTFYVFLPDLIGFWFFLGFFSKFALIRFQQRLTFAAVVACQTFFFL